MAYNRTLSTALREQLFSPYRDKDIRILVDLDHPSFAQPFRFVSGDPNEFASLTSNGDVYQTFPFELILPTDEDGEPSAMLRVMNADDRIGSTIRELTTEAVTATLRIVMRETPDVIEYEAGGFELVDVEETALFLAGRLVARGSTSEPCPGRVLSSRISPVFFR